MDRHGSPVSLRYCRLAIPRKSTPAGVRDAVRTKFCLLGMCLANGLANLICHCQLGVHQLLKEMDHASWVFASAGGLAASASLVSRYELVCFVRATWSAALGKGISSPGIESVQLDLWATTGNGLAHTAPSCWVGTVGRVTGRDLPTNLGDSWTFRVTQMVWSTL